MKSLPILTVVFSVLSVVIFLLIIFLRTPFAPYPLMSNQDAVDLLTPLILIPVYWLLFKSAASDAANWLEELAFMVLASVWTLGQGVHLSADSMDNLAEGLAKQKVIDITGASIYQLTYFYDEHLSHYTWHLGVLGLAALLVYREWRRPAGIPTVWPAAILAGILYGFTYFCIFLEGQTVPLGLPFAAALTLATLLWGRDKLTQRPVGPSSSCPV